MSDMGTWLPGMMIRLIPRLQSGCPWGDEASWLGFLLAMGIGVIFLAALFWLALSALMIYFAAYRPLSAVPPRFREMSPAMAWFMLIPVVGLAFLWILIPFRVPLSLGNYFRSRGDSTVGDCGRSLGLAWAICATVSFLPLIGWLAGFAGIVLAVIYMVKVNELASRILRESAAAQAAAGAPTAPPPPAGPAGAPPPAPPAP